LIQAMAGSLGGVGGRANRWGNAGQYLSVLNWASE
jgi:hypothetical protein